MITYSYLIEKRLNILKQLTYNHQVIGRTLKQNQFKYIKNQQQIQIIYIKKLLIDKSNLSNFNQQKFILDFVQHLNFCQNFSIIKLLQLHITSLIQQYIKLKLNNSYKYIYVQIKIILYIFPKIGLNYLVQQKVFGKIIQNLDYIKKKSAVDKDKQQNEFEKISEKFNEKFLNQMKLDGEIVDIGQKIIDSLEDIENKSKRINLEDLTLLQYMFHSTYSVFLQANVCYSYSEGQIQKRSYYIAFLIGYAFHFSQKLQQIEELIKTGRRSETSQQESDQEQKSKNTYFKNMHRYIYDQNIHHKKVQNNLQYEMMANEQLFQYLNELQQQYQQQDENNIQIKMKTQIDYYLLGINILFQQSDSINQMKLNRNVQFKRIFQEIIYLQYYLGNAIHYLNIKYLEKDGFFIKFQNEMQNLQNQDRFNFLEVFERQQKNTGIFIDIIYDEKTKKTQILPVIVPYIRIGEQDEDCMQSQNTNQDQNQESEKKFNMIFFQKFYKEEQQGNKKYSNQNCQLSMKKDIVGIQYKQKEIMDNIKKGQQLVLPSNINFTYGGLFYSLFWNNFLTTIHGNILEPQIYLFQNYCKDIQFKNQQYRMNHDTDSQENQDLEVFNQCRKIQNFMLYEQAKFFIQQCKQSKYGNAQIFSLIIKYLLEKIVINENKISLFKYPEINVDVDKSKLLKEIQFIQKRINQIVQNDIDINFIDNQNIYEINMRQNILLQWNHLLVQQTRKLEWLNRSFIKKMKFYGPEEYLGIEFEKKQEIESKENQKKPKNQVEKEIQVDKDSKKQKPLPINKVIKKDEKIKSVYKNFKRFVIDNDQGTTMNQIDNDLDVNNQIQLQQTQFLENLPLQQEQLGNAQNDQPNNNQDEQPNNQQQPQNIQNINMAYGFSDLDIAPDGQQQEWIYEMQFPENFQQQQQVNIYGIAPVENIVPEGQQQYWVYELQFLDEQEIDDQHEESQQIQLQQIQQTEQGNQAPQMEEEEEEKYEVQYNFDNDFHTQIIYGTPYNNENYQNQMTSYQDRTTNYNYNNELQQQNNLCISQFEFNPLNFLDGDNKYD
ncbi:hypothetical protein TTHERM_00052070 (macronuclear) [Tetrahymena thermophila SB210]|uniref:Uncharacterized protein n=1 Tax=Tetrahymena thermophila (strain SB210) TaxID=312017 RepID=Q23CY3_TETTS|nr:hypothetical protein TTHERM_00052070 [Tetrahymena thermophila SB210]EAR94423.2 hypothetical protein TTHERM_00052070 [Tetrahymena thermophila SB210]|eukprot:XP_001014903.2 hypothetical protein TTHERM_00052070 [Tetrahymena thermophila SB210]